MKKIISSLAIFTLFLGAKFAQAQVIINEVELNPTGERFIELYNSDSSAVDLTNWYIQRKTQNENDFGSLVSKTNFKNKIINPGGYFLISRSAMNNADIILGNLTLTESNTIQLKNSKQVMVDKVSWGDTNDCGSSCVPNPPDGKSIQMISNAWVIALPTPRALNVADTVAPVAPVVSVPVVLPIVPAPETKINTETPKIETKITTKFKAPIPSASNIQKDNDPVSPAGLDLENETNAPNNSADSYLFFGALVFFLMLAGGAVYFIRRKNTIPKAGDDFKILDE